ncbi:MarR family transcriptional regulator [Microbacterium betulae]|uniref:MarR family transcriptional regulator n=1 Tax=Microbacterium betulae TaxID=2981139 RepID=A0AA97FKB1_9MICO|nr:MarR family transcriptional regulator [Microbacterium sp. AB]WOF24625.1 MarR family transcriptional regulator [Microbacterium sp. AB]
MTGAEISHSGDDEVDLIIDAWSTILPGVDLSPLDVMSRLRRVARDLQRVRETAFASSGLRAWEFDILSLLRRSPGEQSMTPSQLATWTTATSGTITYRIERLEERGYVVRTGNPVDQRSRIVTLLPDGRERVESAMRALVAEEARLLDGLSWTQVAALIDSLRTIGGSTGRGR